jgi:hypothetical protein
MFSKLKHVKKIQSRECNPHHDNGGRADVSGLNPPPCRKVRPNVAVGLRGDKLLAANVPGDSYLTHCRFALRLGRVPEKQTGGRTTCFSRGTCSLGIGTSSSGSGIAAPRFGGSIRSEFRLLTFKVVAVSSSPPSSSGIHQTDIFNWSKRSIRSNRQ